MNLMIISIVIGILSFIASIIAISLIYRFKKEYSEHKKIADYKEKTGWKLNSIIEDNIERLQLEAIPLLCKKFNDMQFGGVDDNMEHWFFEKCRAESKTKFSSATHERLNVSYRIHEGAEIEFKFDFYPLSRKFAQRLGGHSNLYELIRDLS